MVFLTEFINSFFAAGELCAVHIMDQENSACRKAFIKQWKRSGSRSVEISIQRYETEICICNIGKSIRKPSFMDYSPCRSGIMRRTESTSVEEKSPVLARDRLQEVSIATSFSENPSKVSKRWILRSGKAALIREENSP